MAFAQTLLRKMLSDSVPDKHYDVFFVVRNTLRDGSCAETRLGAHRVVLSAVSPKFESYIQYPTTSASSAATNNNANGTTLTSGPNDPTGTVTSSSGPGFVSDQNQHHHHNNSSQNLNINNTISVSSGHGQTGQVSTTSLSTAVIYIDDCSTSAVREALEIMYGGELRDAKHCVSLALDIWRFGCLFQVDHLISLARASCLSNLSTDNCLRILLFATRSDDAQIVDKLHQYASQNGHFSHVVSSPDFEKLDLDVIRAIVRPGNGECAWPEILTFEKVWFDALIRWLVSRLDNHLRQQQQQQQQQASGNRAMTAAESDDGAAVGGGLHPSVHRNGNNTNGLSTLSSVYHQSPAPAAQHGAQQQQQSPHNSSSDMNRFVDQFGSNPMAGPASHSYGGGAPPPPPSGFHPAAGSSGYAPPHPQNMDSYRPPQSHIPVNDDAVDDDNNNHIQARHDIEDNEDDENEDDDYQGPTASGRTARMMRPAPPGAPSTAYPYQTGYDSYLPHMLHHHYPSLASHGPSVTLVESIMKLVDFSRMKTHELRDVAKNKIACLAPSFSLTLVDVLLTRSEQLEASVLERNVDLDVIGQKYQQALCEQDEAERKAKAALDKMDKMHVAKVALEKRLDDIRRANKKQQQHHMDSMNGNGYNNTSGGGGGGGLMSTGIGIGTSNSLTSARRKMSGTSTII